MSSRIATLFAALLTLSLVATMPVAGEVDLEEPGVTDIGTDHPLAAQGSIDEWTRTGTVDGELTRYQISVTAAEDGADVGLEPSMVRDTRNHYLRIQYDETSARTLRILLPREFITPYKMETVEGFDSDHIAHYEPAREGEYLAVTIHFDGEGEAILPLQRDSAASYGIVERFDSQIETITGLSPLGRSGEWHYIDGQEVAAVAAYPVNASSEDVLIQYDARPDESDEVWLNAPRGETSSDLVYYYERSGDDGEELYVVSTGEAEPDVRIKQEATTVDRIRGDLNDIRLVPDRIRDGLDPDWWPFGGD